MGAPTKITLAEAIARVNAEPVPYALLFEHGNVAVELFVPRGPRSQSVTHDQDELYMVLSGVAVLDRGGERVTCAPGDVIFVPAGIDHHFDSFSTDFRTWVVYVHTPATL
jgi:mannose-6-phosphate isomerase-like protein (cupin superfamily)